MAKTTSALKEHGWDVIGTLGEGGQAPVYKVRKSGEPNGPDYALKVVRTDQESQAYERFHAEVEALQKVTHPAIIAIKDHGTIEAENLHFYVIEYIPGLKPLKKIIGSGGNPFYQESLKTLDLYTRILEGLQACEKAGVVHRDLSLGNVLIADDYQTVKLIDFGCCHHGDGHSVTLTDEAVGTPNYRAPECEGFSTAGPTIRADLYSAGKLLWSIVTNRVAFSREEPVFTRLALKQVLPEAPKTWHLHHIFAKTIRHDPNNRYLSANDALVDARRIRRVIEANFLPLEVLNSDTCPVCGIGRLVSAADFHENTLVDPETLSGENRIRDLSGSSKN